uniref:AlNc14C179G8194 protein n=1 Tax=Albugo laibachii Nc14 TaxID=890382 RepID=F0WEM6_9STRA|nr:AlNc14C75G5076 [Albugo laibachii Nc14]CCA23090.1 AlNc14C179G8194 [Albugo laibachii Nc14]|eukprot:CCA23090.1 AlNc14C179G8194 [Albugo laibachii Nc14]
MRGSSSTIVTFEGKGEVSLDKNLGIYGIMYLTRTCVPFNIQRTNVVINKRMDNISIKYRKRSEVKCNDCSCCIIMHKTARNISQLILIGSMQTITVTSIILL